jgi:hypothetical protein
MSKQLILVFFLFALIGFSGCGKNSNPTATVEQSPSFLIELTHLNQRLRQEYAIGNEEESGEQNQQLICQRAFLDLSKRYLQLVFNNRQHPAIEFNEPVIEQYNALLRMIRESAESGEVQCPQSETSTAAVSNDLGYSINLKSADFTQTSLAGIVTSPDILSSHYTQLVNAINQNQYPELATMAKLLTAQELAAFKEAKFSQEELVLFEQKLQALLPEQSFSDIQQFKPFYESQVENNLGKKLKYNQAYYSVGSLINRGLMQC